MLFALLPANSPARWGGGVPWVGLLFLFRQLGGARGLEAIPVEKAFFDHFACVAPAEPFGVLDLDVLAAQTGLRGLSLGLERFHANLTSLMRVLQGLQRQSGCLQKRDPADGAAAQR